MAENHDDLSDKEKQDLEAAALASIKFVAQLAQEGERSAVIIGAAKIEEQVEGLLKAVLVNNPSSNDPLFDSDRALGALSAKIEMAYRLGLFTPELRSALDIVRRIRNQFAHSVEFASLADSPQGERVRRLHELCSSHPGINVLGPLFARLPMSESMRSYCSCLMVLIGQLEPERVTISKFEVSDPIDIVPPDWSSLEDLANDSA